MTSFITRESKDKSKIIFETDNERFYKTVQEVCRLCIDSENFDKMEKVGKKNMSQYVRIDNLRREFRRQEDMGVDADTAFQFALDHVKTEEVEEVKHGKWIMEGGVQICSACHNRARIDFNYHYIASEHCSHCGAKMDLE